MNKQQTKRTKQPKQPKQTVQESAREFATKGELLRNAGNMSEAVRCFDRAIELDDTYAYAWAHRGAAKASLGGIVNQAFTPTPDWTTSIFDLEKAIELRKGVYPWAQAQLGEAYRFHARYGLTLDSAFDSLSTIEKSIKAFELALTQDPNNAWTYGHLGATYTLGYWILDVENGLSSKSHPRRLLTQFEKQKQAWGKEANRCFDKALELNSAYPWVAAFQCLLLTLQKDYDAARERTEDLTLLDPQGRMDTSLPMLELLYYQEKFDELVAPAWVRIKDHPFSPEAYYMLSVGMKLKSERTRTQEDSLAASMSAGAYAHIMEQLTKNLIMLGGLYSAWNRTEDVKKVLNAMKDLGLRDVEAFGILLRDPAWHKVRLEGDESNSDELWERLKDIWLDEREHMLADVKAK